MQKLIRIIFPPFPELRSSVGLLIIRLLMGFGIILHGLGKFGNIEGFSEAVGVPYILGFAAAATEVVGGGLLMIGAAGPLAALMLSGVMTVAAFTHITAGDPFLVGPNGEGAYNVGWEFASLYLVGFLCLMLTGPGKLSLDYLLFSKMRNDES